MENEVMVMPISLKKFKKRGYGKNKSFKVGDKVKTTKEYNGDLTTQEPFEGRVTEVVKRNGKNNLVVVATSRLGAQTIDSSWLELVQ